MGQNDLADAIRGKTIRMTWTEGPTAGTTHEHEFHEDGTVEWRDPQTAGSKQAGGSSKGEAPKEQPQYAAVEVADGVYAVSYLAPSGYTLTVVLNLRNQQIVGFASSAKDWHPLRGRLEVAK